MNDARDWAKLLERRGFNTTLLLDRNATGKAMRQEIARQVQSGKAGDVVVVQFSGHGTYVPDRSGDEPDGTDEALCPWDLMDNGPLIDDELAELLGQAAAGVRVIMLSDSCHSGSVARFAFGNSDGRRVRFLPPATFLAQKDLKRIGTLRVIRKATPPGRNSGLLLAGCQDVEYSYDATFKGRPNGAFTYCALQALKSLPAAATYSSWFAAIRKLLPSPQFDYPQRPNLFGTTSQKRWKVLA